jgi:hypothetical protein
VQAAGRLREALRRGEVALARSTYVLTQSGSRSRAWREQASASAYLASSNSTVARVCWQWRHSGSELTLWRQMSSGVLQREDCLQASEPMRSRTAAAQAGAGFPHFSQALISAAPARTAKAVLAR